MKVYKDNVDITEYAFQFLKRTIFGKNTFIEQIFAKIDINEEIR